MLRGQGGDELTGLEDKALKTGASSCYVSDMREEFVSEYLWKLVRSGGVYEHKYLLGTSIARPLLGVRHHLHGDPANAFEGGSPRRVQAAKYSSTVPMISTLGGGEPRRRSKESPPAEGPVIDTNVANSNSLAWRNLKIVNPGEHKMSSRFIVRNIRREDEALTLTFDAAPALMRGGRIVLQLDPALQRALGEWRLPDGVRRCQRHRLEPLLRQPLRFHRQAALPKCPP